MNRTDDVYFPGLNGLRFMAAFAVIVTHIELLKGAFGFKHFWNNPLIFNLGGLGVYFFFVLSGFLITFLLLKEKEVTGEIQVRQFYLRRILRIWPLYYLLVVLGFFMLPYIDAIDISYLENPFHANFYENLLLYIIILPNLAFALNPAVPHIGQVWSIGVEEQFYIFWPLLISRSKKILRTLIVVICTIIFVKILVLVSGSFWGDSSWYQPLKLFVAMSKFECMAIGGIGAFLLHSGHDFIRKVIHKNILAASVLFIPVIVYLTPSAIQDGIHLVFSCIFLIIILNVVSLDNSMLENSIFSYLGKISYGIYMYHFMVIPIVLFFAKKSSIHYGLLLNIFIYMASTGITILVSGISYRFYEKRFIKMKMKFTVVKSGERSPR